MWGKFKPPSLKTRERAYQCWRGLRILCQINQIHRTRKEQQTFAPEEPCSLYGRREGISYPNATSIKWTRKLKSEFIKQLGKFSEEPSIHLHLIGKKMKKSLLTGILSIFGKTKKQRTRNIHVTFRSKGSYIRIYIQLRLHIYGSYILSYIFRIYIRRRLGLTEVWDTFGGEDGCTIWGG